MAVIQYTGIVAGIKGSIGGTTFQKGNVSTIVRAKPNNRLNFSRALVKNSNQFNQSNLMLATQTWRTLNPLEQLAYTTAASSFPFTDKFGNVYTPSGFQLFIWQSLNLLTCGLAINTTPPASVTFPSLAGLSLTVNTTTDYILAWEDNLNIGLTLKVYVALGLSAGKSSNYSGLKFAGHSSIIVTNSINMFLAYTAHFGVPKAGLKYFAAIKVVDNTTGVSTKFNYTSGICT